jgi:putative endonuclease
VLSREICYISPMTRLQTSPKQEKKEDKRTDKRKLGDIGEGAACTHLKAKGFTIIDKNYWKKWGEIDIVAQKGSKLHFIEVKSISREINCVGYRAEDNLHAYKLRRLGRVITTYLLDKNVSDKVDWQFDVAIVIVDQKRRVCRVRMMDDIVL